MFDIKCLKEQLKENDPFPGLREGLADLFPAKIKRAEPPGSQYAGTAAGGREIHILSLMQNSSHSDEGKG